MPLKNMEIDEQEGISQDPVWGKGPKDILRGAIPSAESFSEPVPKGIWRIRAAMLGTVLEGRVSGASHLPFSTFCLPQDPRPCALCPTPSKLHQEGPRNPLSLSSDWLKKRKEQVPGLPGQHPLLSQETTGDARISGGNSSVMSRCCCVCVKERETMRPAPQQ